MSTRKQFLFFCVAGTLGFIVDVAVLYSLTGLLGWYGARAVSFLAAATSTWMLNRSVTFRSATRTRRAQGASVLREFASYLVSASAGGALNYATYAGALHFSEGRSWAPLLGVMCGSIAGMAVNYISARFLVFRVSSSR